MCPLDKFGRLYIGETERSKRPLNALKAAIERYIEIRQNWIDAGSSGYGWRGSFAKGKLFFNRAKTESNVALMRQVLAIIDDQQMRYRQKVEEIKRFKAQLTAKGQGRKLIEVFEETAFSEDGAYLPKSTGLEESIYIRQDTVFRRDRTLGKGQYGRAVRFASPEGKGVVVKHMLGEHTTRRELEKEVSLFGEVYDLLGRPLFGHGIDTRVLRHASKEAPNAKISLPEVPGQNLRDFCTQSPYNEDELFYAIFNFLERLHKQLNIAHNDCHAGNIMVLDRFYNVFFIDYGLAYKYYDPTGHDRNKKSDFFRGTRQDVTFCVYSIFEMRARRGNNENLSVKEIIRKFRLDRWIGWGFQPSGSHGQTLRSHLIQKVNDLNDYTGLRARLRA